MRDSFAHRVMPLEWTGSQVWSWTLPERRGLMRAVMKDGDAIVLHSNDHHLHCLNYSEPFKGRVAREELLAHLHSYRSRGLPASIHADCWWCPRRSAASPTCRGIRKSWRDVRAVSSVKCSASTARWCCRPHAEATRTGIWCRGQRWPSRGIRGKRCPS